MPSIVKRRNGLFIMQTGPLLNNNKVNSDYSSQNSLGIESIVSTMQDAVCPVVGIATNRPFYWAFLVWNFYDFYMHSGMEKTSANFSRHARRQDFFFVLATLLCGNDNGGLAGVRNVSKYVDKEGPFSYDNKYYGAYYGGMDIYYTGCIARDMVATEENGNPLSFPKLNSISRELGESFERVIKDTKYYQEYRLADRPVPRDVLIEYGQVINLGLKGFDETKSILRHRLFETDPQLASCAAYITYLKKNYSVDSLSDESCRRLFFDHVTKDGVGIIIPDELKAISDAWEIIVGRMYFAAGLEMIWKPMLEWINVPRGKAEWIEESLNKSDLRNDINTSLKDILPACTFDFAAREEMIRKARSGRFLETSIKDGLKVMLSIYNWIQAKEDLGENEAGLLNYGYHNNSIPLRQFVNTVNEYLDRPIQDFMIYIMNKWLIEQHFITAFEKLLYGIDGFSYEIIDNKYYKRHGFGIGFQPNRMVRVMKVMTDLNML